MKRTSAVKHTFTVEDVYARARETLEQCLLNGVTHMRTHVEVDPNVGLRGFEAIERLAKDYAWAIDLQVCVFLQEGWTNVPGAEANVVEALKRGAQVVGGAPRYDTDGPGQIERIFALAKEFDVDVDIHLDGGYTTHDMDIYQVCDLADRIGWGGRVAIGHGNKYSCLPQAELEALGRRLADFGRRGDGASGDRPVHQRTPYGAQRHPRRRGCQCAHRAGGELLDRDQQRAESVHAVRRLLARAHREPLRECRAARHGRGSGRVLRAADRPGRRASCAGTITASQPAIRPISSCGMRNRRPRSSRPWLSRSWASSAAGAYSRANRRRCTVQGEQGLVSLRRLVYFASPIVFSQGIS